MKFKFKKTSLATIAALGFCVAAMCIPQARAADIEPSSLSLRGGGRGAGLSPRSFLGEWVLTVDMGETPMHLILTFVDVDGMLGATLQSPEQTEAQVITDITVSSLALKLRYAAQFGETETGMILIVRLLDGGTLTGSMADELGLIIGAGASSEEQTLGLGQFGARVRGVRGGKVPGRSTLSLSGADIKVTFGGLVQGSDDFKRFLAIEDGEVFEFTRSRATKFFTGADLVFGNVIVTAGNASPDYPNYPGIYSLWLKKTGDQWRLVFNEEADVWGTQHNSETDVAEVPLTLTKTDKEQARFSIDLEEDNDEGVMRLAWGPNQWTTRFTVRR